MTDRRSAIRVFLACCALVACSAIARTPTASAESVHFGLGRDKTLEFPGPKRFWNTSGLVISPARIVAQTGTEVPMFAAVCDGESRLLPYETVEWMLDPGGVGSIVSVAEPIRPFCLDVVSAKAQKFDNQYARTETLPANVILTRGTPDLNDDMVMPRGYTWVTVTSPKEGTSYVTAYAPDVYSWDVRQKSAVIYWIDAEWTFPGAACAAPGSPVLLTTRVVRRSTKAPLADWIVRYCITGGAAAGFSPDNAQSIEIATGPDGQAAVEIVPAGEEDGMTCVAIELIRSECADPSSPERIMIAASATHVTWGTPAPIATAPLPVVPAPAPAGPPATVPPTTVPLPAEPPSTPAPPATAPPAAPPTTPAPPTAHSTPAPAPRIELRQLSGPQTAKLQEDVRFEYEITNRGDAAATDLVAIDNFDAGLKHEIAGQAVSWNMGILEPGQTRKFGISFRVQRAGTLCHTLEVAGAGGIRESVRSCLQVEAEPVVQQPAMTIAIDGPKLARMGDIVDFFITVHNTGEIRAEEVMLTASFDPAIRPDQASNIDTVQPRAANGPVVWNLGRIEPGQKIVRQVRCTCIAPGPHACATATLIEATKYTLRDEACLQILPAAALPGQAALQTRITGRNNPVAVGSEATYRIVVTNPTNQPQRQVELTIKLPEEMAFVDASGPAALDVVEPQMIRFRPIQEMRPGDDIPFELRLRANRPGLAQIAVSASSPGLVQAATASAATQIVPRP